MSTRNRVHHVIGGGTTLHIAPHLSLSAASYGTAARFIHRELQDIGEKSELHLTHMADPHNSKIETPQDVTRLVKEIVDDQASQIIFFSPAIVDFKPLIQSHDGKYGPKLKSCQGNITLELEPVDKILPTIRETRKDLFLVAFKTTCEALPEEQYAAALQLMKENHANLVLANDVKTRLNMIVTPEESYYEQTTDRGEALRFLVKIAVARAGLTYTRSTVVENAPRVAWESPEAINPQQSWGFGGEPPKAVIKDLLQQMGF